MLFILEKTSKKLVCPGCGAAKKFKRYISTETGEYLSDEVGRCDRESSCGFHYTPKQYFASNPQGFARSESRKAFLNQKPMQRQTETKPFDYLEGSYILDTLTGYDQNSFVQFLLSLFPEDVEAVRQTVKKYLIGTFEGFTVFPRISQNKKVCTAKLMKFNQKTGKRLKTDYSISSLPYELKRAGKLKDDFEIDKRVFFGEHLTRIEKEKPLAVVEAEKTAVIASLCFPEFIWLATGSKQFLKVEKLKRLGQRQIILYPDADGFNEWREIARQARFEGLNVKLSALIEKHGTDTEKAKQFDLADYLINEQNEINKFNLYADRYNAALEKVRTDESLMRQLDTILDEQKSILIIDGGLSETAAESPNP